MFSFNDNLAMWQCPQSGNLHFYLKETVFEVYPSVWQCPQSGNLHFYVELNRFDGWDGYVAMPSVGQSSFLPERRIIVDYADAGGNALSRAIFISTEAREESGYLVRDGGNALSRAIFISTASGKNLD